jgi:signal transduction histidine kinase
LPRSLSSTKASTTFITSNTLKFTDAGSVTVQAVLDPDQPAGGAVRLRFTVADTGL